MDNSLRIEMLIVAIILIVHIVYMLSKDILNFKKSFTWLILCVFILLFSIFPEIIIHASRFFNVISPTNFLFFCAVVYLFLLAIRNLFSDSKREKQIRLLVQENSILRTEVEKLNERVNALQAENELEK